MRRIHAAQVTVCIAQSSCKPKTWEYEKSAEQFDAIKETMCKDIDSILERREDLDEKLTCMMEKLDDIEQCYRRNCLLFTGIRKKADENTDLLILDTY